MNSKAPILTSNKGFTLIELIVGMVITTIIGGLALIFFVNSSQMFRADKSNIETNQNLSAILDIIGNDIKQAGEQITDSNFPVVQIIPVGGNGKASKIIIRRSLAETLPLCADIPKNTDNLTNVIVADGTGAGTCIQTPLATPLPALPATVRAWRDLRCQVDNPNASPINGDYCNSNNSEVLRAAISNNNGGILAFNYIGESATTGSNKFQITASEKLPIDPIYDYNIGSPVYLIDERSYELDVSTRELKLSVNGSTPATLIKGIEKFKVSTKVYQDPTEKIIEPTPTPSCGSGEIERQYMCEFNHTQVSNWKTLAGIKIEIQAQDPGGKTSAQLSPKERAKLSSAAEFFPRNILSR
jgi:prepilin-type N-terminal cleavage/methylation domain-containing protein